MKDFIAKIKARPTYKSHTCLDAGRNIHIVYTTTNIWFIYDTKWEEVSALTAQKRCTNFYFSPRFKEMQEQ